ncbi:MAG: hypothetical protein KBD83_03565 [Gammaproteobacteria bacterium]|nr:hypothetical protein [Gammaproteobacteria bacterium]
MLKLSHLDTTHNIKPADLIPGDLILFRNHYYAEGATIETPIESRYDTERETHLDHTAMYAGVNAAGLHTILHSVHNNTPQDITKPSGLSLTAFRELTNQIDDGVRYDVTFEAIRCHDKDLRAKALKYLRTWANYRIPYDEKRLQTYLDKEDADYTIQRFLDEALQSYADGPGKYRAAKYAARRNTTLTRPGEDGHPGRGLTCAMAIVLAFQVAELEGLVRAVNLFKEQIWPSDKYGVQQSDSAQNFATYLHIIGNNTRLLSNTSSAIQSKTSDFFYNASKIEDFTHRSFPVDAKIITTASILKYVIEHHNTMWEALGEVDALPITFTPKDKDTHKSSVAREVFTRALSSDQLARSGLGSPEKPLRDPIRSESPLKSSIRVKKREEIATTQSTDSTQVKREGNTPPKMAMGSLDSNRHAKPLSAFCKVQQSLFQGRNNATKTGSAKAKPKAWR